MRPPRVGPPHSLPMDVSTNMSSMSSSSSVSASIATFIFVGGGSSRGAARVASASAGAAALDFGRHAPETADSYGQAESGGRTARRDAGPRSGPLRGNGHATSMPSPVNLITSPPWLSVIVTSFSKLLTSAAMISS